MDVILGNPPGLWMLLGVPAVLAIHMLQNKTRRIEISALFLLDHLPDENRHGAVFRKIRGSLLLVLQLLAVLSATWLAVNPLLLRHDSAQSVVFVIDSSFSMQAFTNEVFKQLTRESGRIAAGATHTEWHVMPSDPARAAIYRGWNRMDMLDAVAAFRPDSGEHDPAPTLMHAREPAGADGVVAFVTDHIPDRIAPNTALLAVGRPIDNVGFGSIMLDHDADGTIHWRALIINHSDMPQQRSIFLEQNGIKSGTDTIKLSPGQIYTLSGTADPGSEQMRLVLDPDTFRLDDVLYFRPEQRRVIRVAYALHDDPERAWAERVTATVPGAGNTQGYVIPDGSPGGLALPKANSAKMAGLRTEPSFPRMKQPWGGAEDAGNAHLVWSMAMPGIVESSMPGIVLHRAAVDTKVSGGDITAEDHPLTKDLVWHSLLCRVMPEFKTRDYDQPLVWMGEYPLITLREYGGVSQLLLNFDLRTSNAARMPSIILLLNRFAERIRATLPGTEAGIVELNQEISCAVLRNGGILETITENPAHHITQQAPAVTLTAPSEPGFFSVGQDENLLFSGAANFADTREADFRKAGSHNDLDSIMPGIQQRHRSRDPFAPFWITLLCLTIPASWFVSAYGRRA